jgi:hypothetical protein
MPAEVLSLERAKPKAQKLTEQAKTKEHQTRMTSVATTKAREPAGVVAIEFTSGGLE